MECKNCNGRMALQTSTSHNYKGVPYDYSVHICYECSTILKIDNANNKEIWIDINSDVVVQGTLVVEHGTHTHATVSGTR